MNRVIKFRAWDIQDKKLYPIHSIHFDKDRTYYKHKECNLWLEDNVALNVMQFTGLQDKNGNDIYEGDIVDVIHKDLIAIEHRKPYLVIWDKDKCKFTLEDSGELWAQDKIEVIGNVYENPGLLKGGSHNKNKEDEGL